MWKIVWLLGLWLGLAGCSGQVPAGFNSADISGAAIEPSFAGLKDGSGRERSVAEFGGKAVIVFFGYTACADICPAALSRYASVMKKLGADAGRLQVILISVDPEMDTPERLGQYVTAFHPSFIGLSGDQPATEAVARRFKVFFSKNIADQHESPDDHGAHDHHGARQIDHSAGSYVFDPAGRVRLYVKDDASVDGITGDLRKLLAEKPA